MFGGNTNEALGMGEAVSCLTGKAAPLSQGLSAARSAAVCSGGLHTWSLQQARRQKGRERHTPMLARFVIPSLYLLLQHTASH
jgi:hypothetical protein